MIPTRNPTATTNQRPPPPRRLPPCAACKDQKIACPLNCPFAPYFPADKQEQFNNVKRLFGLRYVHKILTTAENEDTRDDAMTSIFYEANLRAGRPAGGCSTAISVLLTRIAQCQNELQNVTKYIAFAAADAGLMQTPVFENQENSDRDQEINAIGIVRYLRNYNLSFAEIFIGDLLRQIVLCENELQNVRKSIAFEAAKAKLLQNSYPSEPHFSRNSIVYQSPFFQSNQNQEMISP